MLSKALTFSALAILALATVPVFGQGSGAKNPQKGLPQDWSNSHAIYGPASGSASWPTPDDPRGRVQELKRSHAGSPGPTNVDDLSRFDGGNTATSAYQDPDTNAGKAKNKKKTPAGDWSYFLGATTGATIQSANYPAKFGFDLNAAPSCSNDFAVFALNQVGSLHQPSIIAFNNLYAGSAASATATGTFTANSLVGGETFTVNNGTAFTATASAPVKEIVTISVPSNTYCVAPNAGITVQGVNVITDGTAPTGGGVDNISNSNTTAGVTVTVGGVVYTWETSLAASGCGTTLNCIQKGTDHPGNAEALARAINNSGTTCTESTAVNPCYILASGQGANAEATASHTAGTDTLSLTWKCAGLASLYQISTSDTKAFTLTQPTGGLAGSAGTHQFAIPTTASNATLSGNINTALGTVTGASTSYTIPTITLTASTPGSTGITAGLDGAVTGVTVTVATAGSDGTSTSPNFTYWSGNAAVSTTTLAANLAAVLSTHAGVTAANNSSNVVTLTASTAGVTGNTITVASTATAEGFSWGSSTLLGGTNAGICGANPTLTWTYDSAPTAVLTSPTLSLDGTKVAFVEKGTAGSGNGAVLHVIRWHAGDNTSTTGSTFNSGGTANTGGYSTCLGTANISCEFLLKYSTHSTTANTNSQSSLYYDYGSDVLYVGDDDGYLYKINNVFSVSGNSNTPGVVWSTPVTSTPGCLNLSSPVYDYGTTYIVVADSCGNVRSYNSSGTLVGSTLSGTSTPKIYDAPIVDSNHGKVYSFFANYDGTNAAVVQSTLNSSGLTSPVVANVGTESTTVKMHAGVPDNNYYSLPSANFPGYIYVCGNPGGTTANLYRIGFTSNTTTMSTTATSLLSLSTSAEECSPPTEVFNNGSNTDWLALGIPANCAFGGLTGGCVETFNISAFQPNTAYALHQQVLDSNGNLQTVSTAGTSASSAPITWSSTSGGTTTSNTVTFTYAGPLTATAASSAPGGTSGIIIDNVSGNLAAPAFQNSHVYTRNTVITDGTNLQEVTVAGTSQTSGTPGWNATVGGTTTSGTVTFTNIGPAYSHTSSFYYATLASGQTCGVAGGTNVSGCAVNRTQSGLQ